MGLAYQFQGQRSGPPGPLMLSHIVRHIFRMPRPTNLPHTAVAPSEYKPSQCLPQLQPQRCVEYYDLMYLVGAQDTLLSQTSVGLHINVVVR